MKVVKGKPEKIDKDDVKKKMEDEEYKLRVLMIRKKHKGLYKSMMKSRKRRVNESKKLEAKREMHDAKEKEGTKRKGKGWIGQDSQTGKDIEPERTGQD